MNIAIISILKNDSTLMGLIGDNAAATKTKVYPVVVFSTEKAPYVVSTVIGRSRPGKNCGWVYQIQIASYAESYDLVTEINEAVVNALLSANAGTYGGYNFSFVNLQSENDEFLDKDRNLYAKTLVFEAQ